MARRAVFLDRDKTILDDPGYIARPEQVALLPGAAEAVRLLNRAGYMVVVATNQSGVARGLVTEEQLAAVHQRMRELLLEQGARVDAVYYCPFLDGPEATVENYRRVSDLRKPAPGMLLQAAGEWDIVLPDSWMIGDSARDVVAGARAGCRTVLIRRDNPGPDGDGSRPDHVVGSLLEAARIVASVARPRGGGEARRAGAAAGFEPGPGESAAAGGVADSGMVLRDIRDVLIRRERAVRQEDFSASRLVATCTQLLAAVVAVWGVVALFNGALDQAVARLLVGLLLQVATLTALVAGRR